MAYAVPDIITWSRISQVLAGIGEAKKRGLQGGSVEPDLDMYISMTRKDVEYAYEQDPTGDDTYKQANFLYSLCFPYVLEAQFLAGGSGGQVTPVNPSGSRPDQLNFTVAASGTTLIDGQTTVTIPQFIGYNLLIDKNGQPMTQISTALIYYTWNRVTGLLTLNLAAATGDEFQITPV